MAADNKPPSKSGPAQRATSAVRTSEYRRRETQLTILLAALRVCDSQTMMALTRQVLRRRR